MVTIVGLVEIDGRLGPVLVCLVLNARLVAIGTGLVVQVAARARSSAGIWHQHSTTAPQILRRLSACSKKCMKQALDLPRRLLVDTINK